MHLHKWVVVETVEQPSPSEIAKTQPSKIWGEIVNDFWTRPIIVHYRCSVCGKEKVQRV